MLYHSACKSAQRQAYALLPDANYLTLKCPGVVSSQPRDAHRAPDPTDGKHVRSERSQGRAGRRPSCTALSRRGGGLRPQRRPPAATYFSAPDFIQIRFCRARFLALRAPPPTHSHFYVLRYRTASTVCTDRGRMAGYCLARSKRTHTDSKSLQRSGGGHAGSAPSPARLPPAGCLPAHISNTHVFRSPFRREVRAGGGHNHRPLSTMPDSAPAPVPCTPCMLVHPIRPLFGPPRSSPLSTNNRCSATAPQTFSPRRSHARLLVLEGGTTRGITDCWKGNWGMPRAAISLCATMLRRLCNVPSVCP